MDINQLRKFLIVSNKAGYASGGEEVAQKQPDHSKTITFQQGDFSSHDNYFGGEPYGGRVVVFYKKEPLWMMVYYGKVDLNLHDFMGIYGFLREALMRPPKNLPLRGPEKYSKDNYEYKNKWQGDFKSFSGREIITEHGKELYIAQYMGGLINVRKE